VIKSTAKYSNNNINFGDSKVSCFNKFSTIIFIVATSLFMSLAPMVNADDGYKMIIQISSSDENSHHRTLKQVGWIMDEFKFGELNDHVVLEVVAIGPAFDMLAKEGKFAKSVTKLMKRGVTFTADASIQKMMKKHQLPTDLVDGVQHVKVGPAHIVKRQIEGYKYLALFF
jgi:intracellular sulfur oxidation DsrE/DsrF family protein